MQTSPSKKKKLSGYQVFCSEKFDIYGRNYSLIGQQWRSLTQDERNVYIQKANEINDQNRELLEGGTSMKLEDAFQKITNAKPFNPFEYQPPPAAVTLTAKETTPSPNKRTAIKGPNENNIDKNEEVMDTFEEEGRLTGKKRKTMDDPSPEFGTPRKAFYGETRHPSQETMYNTRRASGGFSSFISQFKAPPSLPVFGRDGMNRNLIISPPRDPKQFSNSNSTTREARLVDTKVSESQDFEFDEEMEELLKCVESENDETQFKNLSHHKEDRLGIGNSVADCGKTSSIKADNTSFHTKASSNTKQVDDISRSTAKYGVANHFISEAVLSPSTNLLDNTAINYNNINRNLTDENEKLYSDPYQYKGLDKSKSWENFEIINLFSGVERFGNDLTAFQQICTGYAFKPFRKPSDLLSKYKDFQNLLDS